MTRADWYRILKFLHVAAVVFGFGPAVAQSVVGARLRAAAPPVRLPMTEIVRDIGQRVIAPLGALVLVTGVVAVLLQPGASFDSFSRAWVALGIALWLAISLLGFGLLTTARRMVGIHSKLTGPPTPDQLADIERLGRRQALLGGLTHLLLAVAIFDMVWKPGS